MKEKYDNEGNIRDCYRLSSIVRKEDNIYYLRIPKCIMPDIYLCFQGVKYRLLDVTTVLAQSKMKKAEIFPGIYLQNNRYYKLINKIVDIIESQIKYEIIVENQKDDFRIESDEEDKKGVNTHDYMMISSEIENVDPSLIEQPVTLGGGQCGGCPVVRLFTEIGLCNQTEQDEYFFFSEKQLLEDIVGNPFFLSICKTSDCYKTYESILDKGYLTNLFNYDPIDVECENGTYIASEGKHRICAMKHFGYKGCVPMRITRISSVGDVDEIAGYDDRESHYGSYSPNKMKRLLDSCYEKYSKIGISQASVKKLLNNPEATIIDYLNASIYSYEKIFDV